MVKMSKLWAAGGRPKSGDVIKEIFGCAIKRPCLTRWNSLFDSLHQIIALGWEKVDETIAKLGITKLTRRDKTFLEEYCIVLRPIAIAYMTYCQPRRFRNFFEFGTTTISHRR